MSNAKCPDCGAEITERPQKSKRPGELLLICTGSPAHKWQGRIVGGYLHLSRTNAPAWHGEGRKVKAITVSPAEQKLMDEHGVSQQAVFQMGLDILRHKH